MVRNGANRREEGGKVVSARFNIDVLQALLKSGQKELRLSGFMDTPGLAGTILPGDNGAEPTLVLASANEWTPLAVWSSRSTYGFCEVE